MHSLKEFMLSGLVAVTALPALAAPMLTQPALSPGSQYRIVFVTSATGFGTSTVISTYNTFVNNAANAGGSLLQPLGATWTMIGSTQSVSALTNIGGASALPIYELDGTLVANGTAGLFSGTLLAGISLTELGTTLTGVHVWTGAGADGSTDVFGHFLGNAFNDVEFGDTATTNSAWIHFNDANSALFSQPYFGISSALTVTGSAVPEPSTITLLLTAALLFAGARAYQYSRISKSRVTSKTP